MGFIKEFKEFASQGNVVDMAVGVIIGGAFGKIITSLVEDIITPAILQPALEAANLQNLSELTIAGTGIKYGNFISEVISFLIIAFSIFMMIKGLNKLKKPAPEAAPAEPSATEQLLAEIRDELKKK